MSHFIVDILTPSKVVEVECSADRLKIPTLKGEIDVLPEHTHIIEKIDTGVVHLYKDGEIQKYLVTTGVAKVLGNKVTLLTNVCEAASDIDGERARKALAKAEQRLRESGALKESQVTKFQRKLTRAKYRLLLSE